jgi:hypothetical protein
MPKFSITNCLIYWDTRKNITEQDKEVIIRDLKGLSPTIEKAIAYLKVTALDKKFPEVRFPIGNSWEYKVFIHVFDGPDPLYYRLCIQKTNSDEIIAELKDEKHNIHTFIMEGKKDHYASGAIK